MGLRDQPLSFQSATDQGQTEKPLTMETPSAAESCMLISLLVTSSRGFFVIGFKFFMTGKLYFVKTSKS